MASINTSQKSLKRSTSLPRAQSIAGKCLLLLVSVLLLQLQLSLGDDTELAPSSSASTAPAASEGSGEGGVQTESAPQAAVMAGTLPGESDSDDGNVGAAIAVAEAKRTTVKKELAPTSEPTPTSSQETSATTSEPATSQGEQKQQQGDERPLETLLPAVQRQQQEAAELASMSPGLSDAVADLAEQLPGVYSRDQQNYSDSVRAEVDLKRILPSSTNLFDKEAMDATQMGEMDCHLRNLDYCLAGLLGTTQKILPETDQELEVRCDEMKVTASCMALYNKRCGTLKLFSILAPFAQQGSQPLAPSSNLLTDRQKELLASSTATLGERAGLLASSSGGLGGLGGRQQAPSFNSMMEICEPHAKNSAENKQIRQQLFQLAKCINARVPKLSPCLDDLKTALQMFYEPRRVLPMKPTCCALARLRACSMEALDKVCGLSSFEQLMNQFSGQMGASGGPVAMVKTIDRVCRQASDHRSTYCSEVLPPSGMKLPPRRGSKASKLARALDLISFSPATQDMNAF